MLGVSTREDTCQHLLFSYGVVPAHVAELPEDTQDFSYVAECLVKNGYGVLTIREEEIMLEDAFIRLTDSNHLAQAAVERPTAPPPPPPPPPPQS